MSGVEERVRRALEEYNRYHAPEAEARLVEAGEDRIVVEFRGSFCTTCGFYDYFDDLVYTLEDYGVRVYVERVEETEWGAVVTYRLLKPGEERPAVRIAQPEKLVLILGAEQPET